MVKRRDQEIAEVLKNDGFAFEFFKVLAHAVMDRGGTMQHLRRVMKEEGLRQQIADIVVPADLEIVRPLGEVEYLVYVDYNIPHNRVKLEAEFCRGGVTELFYGDYEWQNHSSCAKIDQTPGNRVMFLKCFGCYTESEANIVEMDKHGYRPATHLEEYAFAKVNRELQRQFRIVALGSFTMNGDDRCVAALSGGSNRRCLYHHLFDHKWDPSFQFLFVRKAPEPTKAG